MSELKPGTVRFLIVRALQAGTIEADDEGDWARTVLGLERFPHRDRLKRPCFSWLSLTQEQLRELLRKLPRN